MLLCGLRYNGETKSEKQGAIYARENLQNVVFLRAFRRLAEEGFSELAPLIDIILMLVCSTNNANGVLI